MLTQGSLRIPSVSMIVADSEWFELVVRSRVDNSGYPNSFDLLDSICGAKTMEATGCDLGDDFFSEAG